MFKTFAIAIVVGAAGVIGGMVPDVITEIIVVIQDTMDTTVSSGVMVGTAGTTEDTADVVVVTEAMVVVTAEDTRIGDSSICHE